jgi:hypothetical protein
MHNNPASNTITATVSGVVLISSPTTTPTRAVPAPSSPEYKQNENPLNLCIGERVYAIPSLAANLLTTEDLFSPRSCSLGLKGSSVLGFVLIFFFERGKMGIFLET